MFKQISRWFRKPKSSKGYVYYARLQTPQGVFYKLGFTSKPSLFERLAYGGHGDEELIDKEFFFTYRDDAWETEQSLLEHFDRKRAFGRRSKDPAQPLCGRGQTELFATDILGLDHDLYARPSLSEEARKEIQNNYDGCLVVLIAAVTFPLWGWWAAIVGVMGFFSFVRDNPISPELKRLAAIPRRPEHPPAIQSLIDSLSRGHPVG